MSLEQPNSAAVCSARWPRGRGLAICSWARGFACRCRPPWVWGQAPRGGRWVPSWAWLGACHTVPGLRGSVSSQPGSIMQQGEWLLLGERGAGWGGGDTGGLGAPGPRTEKPARLPSPGHGRLGWCKGTREGLPAGCHSISAQASLQHCSSDRSQPEPPCAAPNHACPRSPNLAVVARGLAGSEPAFLPCPACGLAGCWPTCCPHSVPRLPGVTSRTPALPTPGPRARWPLPLHGQQQPHAPRLRARRPLRHPTLPTGLPGAAGCGPRSALSLLSPRPCRPGVR